ncbi:hypothetical protein GIB67_003675 [Kingdonia uniflora]|uniref:Uncharacterized protein n=1 Tax=Kingdonia uniflora TaxID=39325 RepID=A0A7J7M3T4_9MAGN|nr:hypothetical protein GIB67_003675 [Kingdonia uniflora]
MQLALKDYPVRSSKTSLLVCIYCSNQDCQQSIKELKEKADELKGVKEELKFRIMKDSKVGNGETASTCPVDDYMRVIRDALNAKQYEMDLVLPEINRMKNTRSIDDMLVM